MVKIGDVELTDEEFNIISKMKEHLSEFTAKRPQLHGKTSTSSRIYLPKSWYNQRVILIKLKDDASNPKKA